MDIRPLPAEAAAVRRYVADVWQPYHEDLADAVEGHALADAITDVEANTEWWLDHMDEDFRAWVAVAGADDESADVSPADTDGELVGFITTSIDECPPVFVRSDWLLVGDFYVREDYRGSGLARELMEQAATRAREADCGALELNVDVDNDRALAFYEKMGFEPRRYRMHLDIDGV